MALRLPLISRKTVELRGYCAASISKIDSARQKVEQLSALEKGINLYLFTRATKF
jgi:hypothetical protein